MHCELKCLGTESWHCTFLHLWLLTEYSSRPFQQGIICHSNVSVVGDSRWTAKAISSCDGKHCAASGEYDTVGSRDCCQDSYIEFNDVWHN